MTTTTPMISGTYTRIVKEFPARTRHPLILAASKQRGWERLQKFAGC